MRFAYTCKYTPVEALSSMGLEMELIEPEVVGFTAAETAMHPNMCSYVKGVLEEMRKGEYDGIILTSCCDSMRRLKDALKSEFPNLKVYGIDLPRKTDREGEKLYTFRVKQLIDSISQDTGTCFREENLLKVLRDIELEETREDRTESPISIGVIGGRTGKNTLKFLKDQGIAKGFDLTCTEMKRDENHFKDVSSLEEYCIGQLNKFPCMRMDQRDQRRKRIIREAEKVDGIIYHNVQFCDMYSYEYASLRKVLSKPLLRLDTDLTPQSSGQIKTRIEAFCESLEAGCSYRNICKNEDEDRRRYRLQFDAENEMKKRKRGKKVTGSPDNLFVLGIDSGSTSTNAVIMDGNMNIVSFASVRTGAKASEGARKAFEETIQNANLEREDIACIVSTGYGRDNIKFRDRSVTEITCHGRGAAFFFPEARTVLDIGGQDSKAIRLDRDGNVTDFAMNDKCAAGTGRFLEAIARTLEIPVTELSSQAAKSENEIEISSMCTVFAESEVISLIAEDVEVSDIARGVSKSIAGKAVALMKRVGMEEPYMMTGGVARNGAVVRALEQITESQFLIPENPDLAGAVGAALFALDDVKSI